MSENLLLENTGGCIAIVVYDYHPYTQELIDAYRLSNMPMPDRIYQAWDSVIRQLAAQTDVLTVSFMTEADPGDPDVARADYSVPELAGAVLIIDVSVEGQGVNESDEATVNINTENGTLVFGMQLAVGARVKITYKK